MGVALLLLFLLSASDTDQHQPGRIFVSYVRNCPAHDREAFESSLGLSPGKPFDRPGLNGPESYFEYTVTPGQEIVWINLLLKVPMVYRASWSAQRQLDVTPPGTYPYPTDEGVGPPVARVGALAVGILSGQSDHPHPIEAAYDELCAKPLVEPVLRDRNRQEREAAKDRYPPQLNRAGFQLIKRHTIHDLLVKYVQDSFSTKGAQVRVVKDFQRRLVFDIDRVQNEVLRHNPDWEQLELEIFFLDGDFHDLGNAFLPPTRCIEVDLTLSGKYAANTLSAPAAGFYSSMEPVYADDEQKYLGEFGAKVREYLESPEAKQ